MISEPNRAADNVPDGAYFNIDNGVVTKDTINGVERDWQRVCISAPGFRADSSMLYDGCLPFHVHSEDKIPRDMNLHSIEENSDAHQWTSDECNIADETLERGYVLSFYAHPNWAISCAVFIAQNLTRNIHARYDEANRRLLIWDQQPREVSSCCECEKGR